ncbi:hypothetical protein [Paraburkholderia bonniea]|uniref:hypothetical protein n=1 Tax=Paraburkholderia bonniea TaxID=2152891 RepID=UPI0012922BFF|nr:hypothetical protein [Paraburkholderia bonniea]
MKFIYQKYLGEFQEYELVNWSESGNYIQGVCTRARMFRTFRKDRVTKYLQGSENLLENPVATSAPCLPPKRPIPSENRRDSPPPGVPKILFTGFSKNKRDELEQCAWAAGFYVRKDVTKDLTFLCTGPNAGPVKIEKSRTQGTYIISGNHFATFIETGELIDEE